MDNNIKKVKGSVFSRQKNMIIALAVIFVVLFCAYFFIIMPLMKDDSGTSLTTVPLIWSSEVQSSNNRIMMFEHINSENVSSIKIHNPSLAVDENTQYVDWELYKAGKNETLDHIDLEEGSFYLRGYEYAPFDSDTISSVINDAGFTLTASRVIDHAKDYSKYGLDYESEEEATYCEITAKDGTAYKFYIGDKIPSGTAYYVRLAGKYTCLDKNSEYYNTEIENDSVYVYDCSNVLISPTDLVTPILTYPIDSSEQSYFDMFTIAEYYGEKGESSKTKIQFYAISDSYKKKPISLFAPMAIYYTEVPVGYYSSSAFENLFEGFVNGLEGSRVCELAVPLIGYDEKTGEEYEYYGFEASVKNKYFENGLGYTLAFAHDGIPNIIDISPMTENGTYYVHSPIYNTICEVDASDLNFLVWDQTTFIEKKVFQLKISNCAEIKISGKYTDYDLTSDKESKEKNVNAVFKLETNDDETFTVTHSPSNLPDSMTESEKTENFRTLYQLLLFTYVKEPIDTSLAEEIMKGEAFAEISVTTSAQTVYVTDDEGNDTAVVDYVIDSMTKIFRMYRYSSGRCLVTIELIDSDGKSSGESGSFYLTAARIELLLDAADDVTNGIIIDRFERE